MVTTTSERIELLRSTLRRFITEEVIPQQREHGLDADQAPPAAGSAASSSMRARRAIASAGLAPAWGSPAFRAS